MNGTVVFFCKLSEGFAIGIELFYGFRAENKKYNKDAMKIHF